MDCEQLRGCSAQYPAPRHGNRQACSWRTKEDSLTRAKEIAKDWYLEMHAKGGGGC